jgi:hypothetical protein
MLVQLKASSMTGKIMNLARVDIAKLDTPPSCPNSASQHVVILSKLRQRQCVTSSSGLLCRRLRIGTDPCPFAWRLVEHELEAFHFLAVTRVLCSTALSPLEMTVLNLHEFIGDMVRCNSTKESSFTSRRLLWSELCMHSITDIMNEISFPSRQCRYESLTVRMLVMRVMP